jgi:hypothetical protein
MKADENILWHQSGVNLRGEPFVQLIRGTKIIAQMDLEQAREHAQAILEAAEASEQDAFILDWAKTKVGTTQEQAAQLLVEFRKFRAERTGKRGGPTKARDWVMPDSPPGT